MECTDHNSDIQDVVGKLVLFGKPKTVVITRGPLPVVSGRLDEKDVVIEKHPVVEMEESEIEDTNGAGDAFSGGFLSEMALGKSLDSAIAKGTQCAHQMLKRKGFKIE